MRTRYMAGAFLTYDDEVLVLHRNPDRKIAPSVWSLVGGHIEPCEIQNPEEACLREIKEETGICKEDIIELNLRYIYTRKVDDEIRIGFIYFGKVAEKRNIQQCDEGTLHWVSFNSLSSLPMTYSVAQTVLHWKNHSDETSIFFGVVNRTNDQIVWSVL